MENSSDTIDHNNWHDVLSTGKRKTPAGTTCRSSLMAVHLNLHCFY